MTDQNKIEEVKEFWSANPCGSKTSESIEERIQYFREIEQYRYSHIRHIIPSANFEKFSGLKVLEIGCGVGTDGRQFAKHGAIYTGINLDQGSTELAKESFRLFGLNGEILQMNAEQLDFKENTFDHIYSHGVIHHSPDTEKIVRNMYNVLKPGGTISVMIYNKSSINYYFEIMFLRKLFRFILIPKVAPKVISKITGFELSKLERHRDILLNEKMTKEKWISINTDGPDCPLAKVYSKDDAILLFKQAGFREIETFVRFFDKTHYSFIGKLIPPVLADYIGNVAGWNRWVKAKK